MDTLRCAILLAKLDLFEWNPEKRREIGNYYNICMDRENVSRVFQSSDRSSVYGQCTIFSKDRISISENLNVENIPTANHYPRPLGEQPVYQRFYSENDTPVASEASEQFLCLPMSPYLSQEDQAKVIDAICT